MLDAIQDMVMARPAVEQAGPPNEPLLSFAAVLQLLSGQADNPAGDVELADLAEQLPTTDGVRPEVTTKVSQGEERSKDSKCSKSPAGQVPAGLVGILEGFGLLDQVEAQTVPMTRLEDEAGSKSGPQAGQPLLEQELADTAQAWMPIAGSDKKDRSLPSEADKSKGEVRASQADASSLENANNLKTKKNLPSGQAALDQEKLARLFSQALARPGRLPEGQPDGQASLAAQEAAIFALPGQTEADAIKAQAPELTVPEAQENLALLVDSLTARNTLAGHECVVTLRPEHLGRVRIQLSLDKGAIRAQIQVESLAAGQLIEKESAQLQDMLLDRGLSLASFDVSQNALFAGSDQKRQPGHAWPDSNKGVKAKGLVTSLEPAEPYSSADLPRLYSSVEFTA